jgi:hypothetical protein
VDRTTILQPRTAARTIWLGVALGMASILAIVLLLEMPADAAPTAPLAPQPSPETSQAPATPTTTLLVGTNAEFWPMEYISGTQIVGHDIDLMNAIAAEISATVVYTNVPWDDLFAGLIAGEYDLIISTVSIVPGRQEWFDFTLPYVAFSVEGWEGYDNIGIGVQQGDTVLRHQLNETLWQLRNDGALGAIVANIAADVPEWQPRLPDWPYIHPDVGGAVVYTDTEGCSTIIQVPGGALTETILLAYTPVHTATAPSGLSFADRAFDLDVYRDGMYLSSSLSLSVPATVTIHYNYTDVVGLDETSLLLESWNEPTSTWEDAACGPYDRHPDEDWLSVPICHLSRFALFGETGYTIYLPLVVRNTP